jgi:hypothetical protein
MSPEELGNLQLVCVAMRHALARKIIDWNALEELLAMSSSPDNFQHLVDLAIRELQAYRDFSFRCANDQAV